MKINPDIRSQTPQTESQNQPTTPHPSTDAAELKQNEALKFGQQRIAAEAKGFQNLNAGLLQRSLAAVLPLRTDKLIAAAEHLTPKFPEMLVRSGSDPDRFISAMRDELATSPFKNLGSMQNEDIMSLAFIVLTNATKSAQEDLKGIMEKVKSINQTKAELRERLLEAQKRPSRDDDD